MTSREIDRLVATKVMGRCWHDRLMFEASKCPDCGKVCMLSDCRKEESFHPSTDIAAAWEVVEKLKTNDLGFILDYDSFHGTWRASFMERGKESDTAPIAICLSALKAVGVEVPHDAE